MLDFDLEQKCYGCGACAAVCPKKAITLKPNFEGFPMPHIDKEKCVECGLCEKKCAYLNPTQPERRLEEAVCRAAYRTNDGERMTSASGGVAAVVTEAFLGAGGVVVGCGWTDDLVAEHMAVHSCQEAQRLRSSKYVQSDMTNAYGAIRTALSENKKVLFVGTPCQAGAVRNVFGDPEGLYIIGLICGGVPSPKVWEKFKLDQQRKYGAKMVSANFKYKGRYWWNTPVALYRFENGKKSERLAYQLDDYVLQFLYGVFKRNSCHQCGYKGDGINADLVLGDYWGSPEFRNQSENKGVSAIVCLSAKGEACLDLLNGECNVIETDLKSILHKNKPLIASVSQSGDREAFFQTLEEQGYSVAAAKYGGQPNPLKRLVFTALDRTGLFEYVKRFMKG